MLFCKLRNQRGSAVLIAVMVLLMMTLIGIQMHSISVDDMEISGNSNRATKAFYAAEAGLALAQSILWNDYVSYASTNPYKESGKIGNRATYTAYLDGLGLIDSASAKLVVATDVGTGQFIDSVVVERLDGAGVTELDVTSYGSADDNSHQEIAAVLKVEGEAFKGFEFAILANNVNCIMCHARIDNVDRVFNTDTSKTGTFDRVKVAALESMLIRTTSADSYVAGTVYTRGIVTDKKGNPITNLSPTGGGLEGWVFDTTGKIQEPMNTVPLTNTTGDPLPQYGNLYMNYPTDDAQMTDGELPTKFPPPFPDDNGNKQVDDAEFQQVADNASGGISGGLIYAVSGNYNQSGPPNSGNRSSITGSHDGNLILIGTPDDPIVITDDIAVNGDVIIQGVVKGTGQIFAKGNVYVTGDITYADGTDANGNRTFGKAADGTRNLFSIAAGKNIMVGDYLTLKKQSLTDLSPASMDPGNLTSNEEFSFAQSEMTLFNRSEWTKTQEFLPTVGGGLAPNPSYIPGYKPRYYTMNEGDPVYIYNKINASGKGTYWDPDTQSWLGKEHASNYDLSILTMLPPGAPELTNATVVSLSSSGGWISPEKLKTFWIADENQRAPGDPFKIDGQLYTNNSTFTLSRKRSKTGGRMEVNGALVSADVGVLVGVELKLNYDQRLKNFLKIKDDSQIAIARASWFARR